MCHHVQQGLTIKGKATHKCALALGVMPLQLVRCPKELDHTYKICILSCMDIEYDPEKAASNLEKHGISFEEAASSLLDSNALVQEDIDSEGENRWVLV